MDILSWDGRALTYGIISSVLVAARQTPKDEALNDMSGVTVLLT